MKKPWLAFVLNFLLAGAGMAYLGMWAWAVVNLIVALAAGVCMALFVPSSQLGWLEIVLPVVNGVIAQTVAKTMNAKLQSQQDRVQSLPSSQSPQSGGV